MTDISSLKVVPATNIISLRETKMPADTILVALIPHGFELFKHHLGLVNGIELNKADSQLALTSYIELCAKQQLVFLNTEIKPFKLAACYSIFATCSGSFDKFKRLLEIRFNGVIPKTKYPKFLYNFFQSATRKDRQNKNNECTPSIWTRDRTPAMAKARAMAESTSGKTIGAHMNPFTNFDYRQQKRVIQRWLADNLISEKVAKELREALASKNKSYLKAISSQSVRIFGHNLRARYNNSSARVVNNAVGLSGGGSSKKRYAVDGFKIEETDKIAGNVNPDTKKRAIQAFCKDDHVAAKQLEAEEKDFLTKKRLILNGNRTQHKKAYCLTRLEKVSQKRENRITGLGEVK